MSAAKKGFRWTEPDRGHAPLLTDELTGQIWADAPSASLLRGRKIIFDPDFSYFYDWSSAAADANGVIRTAGTNDSSAVAFGGGYWASLNITSAGAGTEIITNLNGRLAVVTDNADNDLFCLTFNGGGGSTPGMRSMPFAPRAGTKIRFGFRSSIQDATQVDFLVGLSVGNNVDPIGSAPDGIYIRKDDADTQPDLVINGASETVKALTKDNGDAITMVSAQIFEVGFVVNGITSIDAYFNGHLTRQTNMTNLVSSQMCPIIEIQNGEGANKILIIEKMVCTQDVA